MREFFRGWKRKVGVATLGMACVFAAGWVRSLNRADKLELGNLKLLSLAGGLIWRSSGRGVSLRGFPNDNPGRSAFYSSDDYFDPYSDPEHWILQRFGFGMAIYQVNAVLRSSANMWPAPTRFYRVPYWSIVVPLTLLSAYLLLSKPRRSTATNFSESKPVEAP